MFPRGTVDRVLNNRGKVNPEKEERVRRIAQELGYKPNVAGKGLAARKKHLKLGFICVDDEFAPFYRCAQRRGKAGGGTEAVRR